MSRSVDLLILGAGVPGLLLATSLRLSPLTRHLQLLVLDKAPPAAPAGPPAAPASPGGHPFSPGNLRSSLLNKGSLCALSRVGLDKNVLFSSNKVDFIKVWQGMVAGRAEADVEFRAEEAVLDDGNDGTSLGAVLPNAVVVAALAAIARDLGIAVEQGECVALGRMTGPAYSGPARPFSVRTSGGGWEGEARLVVGAEGAHSPSRAMAGISTTRVSYQQEGVVATLELDRELTGAVQAFLPTGPVAVLPFGVHGEEGHGKRPYGSLVWSAPPPLARELLRLPEPEFVARINAVLSPGATTVVSAGGQRASWPLTASVPASLHARRYVLIGDAAHTCHPLAGQGLNLGVADAVALHRSITDAVRSGSDVGSLSVTSSYERERVLDITAMTTATHVLQRLFAADQVLPAQGALRVLRDLGMRAFNRFEPAKQIAIRTAMGANVDLSSFATNQTY
jgi:ubiquinone biosynthesis UbiH/UbiF/VisC/COQ6 family hydroxylase